MDMPSYWYEAIANVLSSGVVYKLYYPNYQIFTGQSTANKAGTCAHAASLWVGVDADGVDLGLREW